MTGKPLDRRPQRVLDLPPKECAICHQPFGPRPGEYRSEYLKRRCCSRTCRAINGHLGRAKTPGRPRYIEDDLAWRWLGACRGVDPELFDITPGPQGPDTRIAKAICAMCPVRVECLTWAVRNDEWGVWGGTTRSEREQMTGGAAG